MDAADACKALRLGSVRLQDRSNALVRARAFRSELHRSTAAAHAQLDVKAAEQRGEELDAVQRQLEFRIAHLGEAQLQAAQVAAQRGEELQGREDLREELNALAEERSQARAFAAEQTRAAARETDEIQMAAAAGR
ncbi:hypothetical protein FOA52_009569 [Chlamydomonas sp. UWO 241]|nr:hypothetical protein FOA52_009569 [Chlamydomonas sp. UWO 241]